jgi:hypothetical protein
MNNKRIAKPKRHIDKPDITKPVRPRMIATGASSDSVESNEDVESAWRLGEDPETCMNHRRGDWLFPLAVLALPFRLGSKTVHSCFVRSC